MLLQKAIPLSYILGNIWRESLFVLVVSIGAFVAKEFLDFSEVIIPPTIPAILGTCISLLLAFRTSQAYDRWWEARKAWGSIVNNSRNLVRQAIAYFGSSENGKLYVNRIAKMQIAWNYSLACQLRGVPPVADIERVLTEVDVNYPSNVSNPAIIISAAQQGEISNSLREGLLSELQQIQLAGTIAELTNAQGICERIKTTIFPRLYSAFVHNFIYLLVIMIPLGLPERIGWTEMPIVFGIGIAFFFVESAARSIQDPFANRPTDTAMLTISRNIEIGLREMLNESDIPEKYPPRKFYAE